MKYICNYCGKKYPACIAEVTGMVPQPPYSCLYANDAGDMEADWKEMKKRDFEMNGLCADCSNYGCSCSDCDDASGFSNEARQQRDAPLMSDNLRSAIDAANKISAIKNGSPKDPKSRYYGAGGFETLDIIKAKLTPEQYRGFLLGNIIKYSCRANHKGEFDRDIEKVRFYGAAIFDTLLPEDRK